MPMAYKLTYTAQLQQIGPGNAPIGNAYSFGGSQFIASANPQTADLTTAAAAMQTDILNQMVTGTAMDPSFAAQQSTDSTQD